MKKLYKFQTQNNLLIPKRNGLILRLFKAGEILAYPTFVNCIEYANSGKEISDIFSTHTKFKKLLL